MVSAVATRGAPKVRSWALYAVAAVALIATIGWLLTMAFPGSRDAAAIRLSAIVAIVVQLVAFAITKAVAQRHLIAGWGAGSLLRFMALVVFALLAVKVLDLPPVAALVSLATFLFLSTLIEPLFLRR
jgi:4-amino-4-deoxy-L-arabinose transferase-like glycosyltransferase